MTQPLKTHALSVFAVLCLLGCAESPADPEPETPDVAQKPVELEAHGDIRIDPYYWLNERDNPDVIAYLQAENAYVETQLEDIAPLREALIEEMAARYVDNTDSVPYQQGDYEYYWRYEPDADYVRYYRRHTAGDGQEQLLLDVQALAGDASYYDLASFTPSPDNRIAAFAVDTVGRRLYTLRFLNLDTGEFLPGEVENATTNFEWSANSTQVLYTNQDPETLRWNQVYRYDLETGDSTLLYEEADEEYYVYVYKSLTGEFIYLNTYSTVSSETHYLPAADNEAIFTLFSPREEDHIYSVTDGGGRFFVLSNRDAVNFQLFDAAFEETERDAWSLVVPHRDNTLISGIEVYDHTIILLIRQNAQEGFEIFDRATGETYDMAFAEDAFNISIGYNVDAGSRQFRYQYSSMTTPWSTIEYDLDDKTQTILKEESVGGYDRNNYVTERLMAPARDGTDVPVTLVYRKGIAFDGSNPLVQYGYGSYGAGIDPGFSATRISLLDRGFVYAIAHIRGGDEMGRQWYYDGRQQSKINTFTDFIDVSTFLIDEGYTSSDRLFAVGASAGGLLTGAVANMAPELYQGIVVQVPFLDVVTTMLDDSIPLTSSEWDEWGNPSDKDDYEYMLSYSPYDQITAQDYPHLMVTGGLHDSQVQYFEPAKWVAKLRDYKTDDNLLLFYTDMEGGHSGKTGRYNVLWDYALEYVFYLKLAGITE